MGLLRASSRSVCFGIQFGHEVRGFGFGLLNVDFFLCCVAASGLVCLLFRYFGAVGSMYRGMGIEGVGLTAFLLGSARLGCSALYRRGSHQLAAFCRDPPWALPGSTSEANRAVAGFDGDTEKDPVI